MFSKLDLLGEVTFELFSNTLFKIYSSRYYFPKSDTIFSFNIMIYSLILPILFILLVSYLFIGLQLKDKKQRYKEITPIVETAFQGNK